MKKTGIFTFLAVLMLFCGIGQAAQWKLDPAHAEIRFEIMHIFSYTSGSFTEFDGDIDFDPAQPEKAVFDFTVAVKSINTLNGKRDTHLRSKDFFHTDEYPEMRFRSSRVEHIADNRYSLTGMLKIKEEEKEISMPFSFYGPKAHPLKKSEVVGFNTEFEINRLDYGVGDGKFFERGVVGDRVFIKISVEAFGK